MTFFLHQNEISGCGVAALKMFLANFYKNKSYLFEKFAQPATNFLEIINIAEKYHIHLTGYNTGNDDKKAVFKTHNMLIAQLLIGKDLHFVFIANLGRWFVRIYDPRHGSILISHKKFLELFTGKFLITEEKPMKNTIKSVNYPRPPKQYYFSWLLSLIGVSSLLMAFYYVDDGVSIYRPLIFLLMAGIFALLNRAFLLAVMKDFQKRYINECIFTIKPPYLKTFNDVFVYKKNLFYRQQQTFTTLITAIIIIFLIVFNGYWHLIAMGFILISAWISDLIKQYMRGREYLALIYQSRFIADLENQTIKEAHGDFQALSQISNYLSEKKVFLQLFVTTLLFLLAFFIMSISHIASLNYLLFHFVVYQHLYSALSGLIASPSSQPIYTDDINNYLQAFH